MVVDAFVLVEVEEAEGFVDLFALLLGEEGHGVGLGGGLVLVLGLVLVGEAVALEGLVAGGFAGVGGGGGGEGGGALGEFGGRGGGVDVVGAGREGGVGCGGHLWGGREGGVGKGRMGRRRRGSMEEMFELGWFLGRGLRCRLSCIWRHSWSCLGDALFRVVTGVSEA